MPSLGMEGAYKLDAETIEKKVTKVSPGNYALGQKNKKGNFVVKYVGRADKNVKTRLKSWVGKTDHPLFKFCYASSAKEAFENECKNFHDFNPSGNDIHPDRPDGATWECPSCDIFD